MGWAVVEYVSFGQREDCPYWRGIVIHHAVYSGDDAQKQAEERAVVLCSQGLKIVAEEVKPLRPSLPYQGIARRVLRNNK